MISCCSPPWASGLCSCTAAARRSTSGSASWASRRSSKTGSASLTVHAPCICTSTHCLAYSDALGMLRFAAKHSAGFLLWFTSIQHPVWLRHDRESLALTLTCWMANAGPDLATECVVVQSRPWTWWRWSWAGALQGPGHAHPAEAVLAKGVCAMQSRPWTWWRWSWAGA